VWADHDQGSVPSVKNYEVVYIFDTQVPEDRINEKLERYHGLLTGQGGGEITATDHWGRRQLTYPIRRASAGYYVVAQFQAEPAALPEFERLLKLDEELLRYLVVLHEGEPTAPMSIATKADRRRDEDEDDEDGPLIPAVGEEV
jgi:small subunit ribosomal protein S6